ncbi:cytochrome c maturation protein CcmE [Massilia oculi]|uniref:Cytochrome c-type biogenesis protein CcmE n=1 Tax=Massilia hydrophila TaxID=3044279 RepID=A0ABS7Y424_9BURK|nr:cytochrome c maturation protein CcmE [Massilia oculi]MCA1854411.1 cytochrome c maturation protein CcmE [Massilia oculi]
MKARQQRLALVLGAVLLLGLAAWLVLSAFRENLVFFYTPTQIAKGEAPSAGLFRMGGMVEEGSVRRHPDGLTVSFAVTDMHRTVPVVYQGALPDLFKEGKGVVAQGRLQDGRFTAQEVLAKHDENYMPPEAAYALAQQEAKAKESNAAGNR